jgi:hypothetical protein
MNQDYPIEIFKTGDGRINLEVQLRDDTVWLSQAQLVVLFGRDKSVISRHIRNIFDEGELTAKAVVAKNATTAKDGKVYQVAKLSQIEEACPARYCDYWRLARSAKTQD